MLTPEKQQHARNLAGLAKFQEYGGNKVWRCPTCPVTLATVIEEKFVDQERTAQACQTLPKIEEQPEISNGEDWRAEAMSTQLQRFQEESAATVYKTIKALEISGDWVKAASKVWRHPRFRHDGLTGKKNAQNRLDIRRRQNRAEQTGDKIMSITTMHRAVAARDATPKPTIIFAEELREEAAFFECPQCARVLKVVSILGRA